MLRDQDNYEGDLGKLFIGDKYITHCEEFKYLGTMITEDLTDKCDVIKRIRLARVAWENSASFLRDNRISLNVRKNLFQAIITSILTYGAECWALRRDDARKLKNFYNRCVRKILGRKYGDGWSTMDNCKWLGVLPMQAILDWKVLQWIGKISRMDNNRLPRKFLFSTLIGNEVNSRFYGFHKHVDVLLNKLFDVEVIKKLGMKKENWLNLAKDEMEWDNLCINCPLLYVFISDKETEKRNKKREKLRLYVDELRCNKVEKKWRFRTKRNFSDIVEYNIIRLEE